MTESAAQGFNKQTYIDEVQYVNQYTIPALDVMVKNGKIGTGHTEHHKAFGRTVDRTVDLTHKYLSDTILDKDKKALDDDPDHPETRYFFAIEAALDLVSEEISATSENLNQQDLRRMLKPVEKEVMNRKNLSPEQIAGYQPDKHEFA